MNKKAKIILYYFLSLVIVISLLLVCFVIAQHVVKNSGGTTEYNVVEDTNNFINITINVTNQKQTDNITEVNMTFPNSLTFTSNSNGTNAGGKNFTSCTSCGIDNVSTVLTFTNVSERLMNGSVLDITSFWFNITPSTPGNFNISVSVRNQSEVSFSNISIHVNDTTSPVITPNSPNNNTYDNDGVFTFQCSVTDNYQLSSMEFFVYNSTSSIIVRNLTSFAAAETSNTTSWVTNFSLNGGVDDGVYTWNCYANDTTNNINMSSENHNRTITLDKVQPNITLITPTDESSSTSFTTAFTFNVTEETSTNCSLVLDGLVTNFNSSVDTDGKTTILTNSTIVGTHTWSVNCTDSAVNSGNSSISTIYISAIPESTGSSGGGSSSSGGAADEEEEEAAPAAAPSGGTVTYSPEEEAEEETVRAKIAKIQSDVVRVISENWIVSIVIAALIIGLIVFLIIKKK